MKFTEDWKTFHRRLSTWFELAAVAFYSYLAGVPDAVIQIWSILPDDIKQTIPPGWIQYAGIALIVIGSFCKIVDQPKLRAGVGSESKP